MADKKSKDRAEIILEEVRGQYAAIQENLDLLHDVPKRLGNLEDDMEIVKGDLTVIKTVVKEISETEQRHERDIQKLKTRVWIRSTFYKLRYTKLVITILYRPNSEHERAVMDFQRELARNQIITQMVNIDSRDGSVIARLYDIVQYPGVLAIERDGRLIQAWSGELPLIDQVSYVGR